MRQIQTSKVKVREKPYARRKACAICSEQTKCWCNAATWNKDEWSHLPMKGMQRTTAITRIGLTAETSRADNLSASSRDHRSGLRIDGSYPHGCPLGQDTITMLPIPLHLLLPSSPPCGFDHWLVVFVLKRMHMRRLFDKMLCT